MKSLNLILLSCLSLCLNQVQAMKPEVDMKVDVTTADHTNEDASAKKVKDAAIKPQSEAKAQTMVSDVYKEKKNESSPLIKSDKDSPEAGSFNLTDSLLDEDKIQADKDIETNKFKSGEDFLNYVSYKLQQLGDMFLTPGLPTDVTLQLNDVKNINKDIQTTRENIQNLQQKYIKSYNSETDTYGYDEETFKADVKKVLQPIVDKVNTLAKNISDVLKKKDVSIDQSRVQNYLKDFSKDLNQAIKTEYTSSLESKKAEDLQDKKSGFSPRFNESTGKAPTLFS